MIIELAALAATPVAAVATRRRPVLAGVLLTLWAAVLALVLFNIGRYGECFNSSCPGFSGDTTVAVIVSAVACAASLFSLMMVMMR